MHSILNHMPSTETDTIPAAPGLTAGEIAARTVPLHKARKALSEAERIAYGVAGTAHHLKRMQLDDDGRAGQVDRLLRQAREAQKEHDQAERELCERRVDHVREAAKRLAPALRKTFNGAFVDDDEATSWAARVLPFSEQRQRQSAADDLRFAAGRRRRDAGMAALNALEESATLIHGSRQKGLERLIDEGRMLA